MIEQDATKKDFAPESYDGLRNLIIEAYGLDAGKTNGEYTFFHDESNNVRKFLLKDNRQYNNAIKQVFVLGGLMIPAGNQIELPGIDTLIKSLSLQKTIREIKCEHIAGKGNFLDAMKSQRLNKVLNWIRENNLWIHFRSVDYLYYGLVDIIDEYSARVFQSYEEICVAKDALYQSFCEREAEGAALLFQFEYPNVGPKREIEFYVKLKEFYRGSKILSKNEKELLNQVVNEAIRNPSSTFLTGNEPYVIQKFFTEFYYDPIQMFCNSWHYFDEEKHIESKLGEYSSSLGFSNQERYRFLNSKDSYSIQLADVMVGVMSKLFAYVDSISTPENVEKDWNSLNFLQRDNLGLLSWLVLRSMEEFPALINRFQPRSSCIKLDFVLEYACDQINDGREIPIWFR